MVTHAKTMCPACRSTVEVDVDAIALDDDLDWYAFTCPACDRGIRKPADAEVRRLLLGAGARTIWAHVEQLRHELEHGALERLIYG